ncbi:MAG: sigma 54 modulation/S30EA ribosomal C-terminal domain-containing protein [Erysipelotrichaceae bacterium]|nr:sigma 54 modulation/S30EA ribosomal C-terminal domain-containing protein [Erysipelotrichaceae bacterium]
MKILFIDRGIGGGISSAMKEYAEKKLGFCGEFFGVEELKLTVTGEKLGIEVSTRFIGESNHHFYFTRFARDYYSAIDLLEDQIHSALEARKGRPALRDSKHSDEEPLLVVKEKHIIASQMDIDEARQEMLELGHSWFVFRNDDNDIAVLYRRYDGDLGVIVVK